MWISHAVIAGLFLAFSLACIILSVMLKYRFDHNKTTIEMDLLLRQMRLTARMRTGLGLQRDRIDSLNGFYDNISDSWKTERRIVKERFGYDLGEMQKPPDTEVNIAELLADIEAHA